ncbi:protein bride of sevenless-like [Centruroides vittatus]|uniref:protein bride of sevenless-like n=1 Tax=Centruroides vittatus TaxID=120091 RepID=UPI003510BC27
MRENIELNLDSYKPVVRSLLVVESSEILNNEKYENLIKKLDNDDLCLDCYASDPSVRAATMAALKYTWATKKIKDAECLSENKKCPHLKRIIKKQLIKKLNGNFREELDELPSQTGNSTIWSYQDTSQSNAIFHQVGYFAQNKLKINTKKLDILQPMGGGWFKIPHFHCEKKCNCLNEEAIRPKNTTGNGIWKSATWVTVCVTVSCIGIIVSATILAFILYHMCSGISLEGHHGFILLTLIGIIVLYASVLPYAFHATETVCALRASVLGLGYAAVFSPMIARCLMLATSGTLGLAGHINGIIQTSLYCFIFGIQVALSAQYWWLNLGSHILYETHCPARCATNQTITVSLLIYNMLLLATLLFLTPFCIKTRRNYREGLFFHLASLVTFAVWVTWFTLYFVFSSEWTDPALCLGFVSTATVIVVIVFLPRVYKIATASSRNNSKMRLRSIDQLTSSIRSNNTSRNLYSSVKNTFGPLTNSQPLKDEVESDVYDDGSLPTITHL